LRGKPGSKNVLDTAFTPACLADPFAKHVESCRDSCEEEGRVQSREESGERCSEVEVVGSGECLRHGAPHGECFVEFLSYMWGFGELQAKPEDSAEGRETRSELGCRRSKADPTAATGRVSGCFSRCRKQGVCSRFTARLRAEEPCAAAIKSAELNTGRRMQLKTPRWRRVPVGIVVSEHKKSCNEEEEGGKTGKNRRRVREEHATS
jgi:hypothetical protein